MTAEYRSQPHSPGDATQTAKVERVGKVTDVQQAASPSFAAAL